MATLEKRKEQLFKNPAMVCAIYLDPRFKCQLQNEPILRLVEATLVNQWERLKSLKNETVAAHAENADLENSTTSSNENFGNGYSELDDYFRQTGVESTDLNDIESGGSSRTTPNYNESRGYILTALQS